MRFGKKALAFLTVMLMIFSNGFSTLPALAAGQLEWPNQEFNLSSFDPYLGGKGYYGVKCDGMSSYAVGGNTPVWTESGHTELKYDELENRQLRYVAVKGGNNFYLYRANGEQVVPTSDTTLYTVSVSGSGGYPSVSVSLADGQPAEGNGISHIALFFSGREIPTGEITIKKCFDGVGGDPDLEFSFTVTGPGSDGPARTVKVKAGDSNGTTIKVPYGTYYIKETVPVGYRFLSFSASPSSGTGMETDDTLRVIVGEPTAPNEDRVTNCYGPNFTVTCKNRPLARLDLGKAVAGAADGDTTAFALEITRPGFSQTVTLTNGQRQVLWLEPGTYTIEEKTVDADYRFLGFTAGNPVPGKNAVEVKLGKGCWSLSLNCNNQKLGKLVINKTDSVSGGPVAGVVFEISGPDFNGRKTTGDSGRIELIRLKPGDSYSVQEISAPDGYNIKNTGSVAMEIPVGGTAVFDFADDPMGRVRITKLDACNPEIKLDGAIFQIANNAAFDNAITLPATTDGVITSGELLAGHWWVREITPPQGYVMDPTVKEVDVKLNSTAEVEFRNIKDEGSIRVRKLDRQTGKPVQGVTFQLLARSPADPAFSGDDILATQVTGADGIVLFEHLKPGTACWVRETAGPAGYKLDPTDARQVTVVLGQTLELTFENDEVGRIQITKIDKHSEAPLDGAVFQIADNAAFDNAITLPATVGGITTSGELVVGHWWVKEITPPDGYVLDPAPANNIKEVDVVMNQTATITFANQKNVADLVVLKLDRQSNCPLPGAIFKLFKADPQGQDFDLVRDFVAVSVSGLDGKARFFCLTPGDYWLVEFAAPLGFRIDPVNNQKVTVGPAGSTVSLTCYNDQIGWLKIVKTDGAGAYLPDAEVKVSANREDFSNAITLVTTANGTVTSGCLVAGTYWVKETKAPGGYVIDNPDPVEVQVKWLETATVTFTDTRDEGALRIRKVSTVGETPLEGVTFELMDKDPADPGFAAENILDSRMTDGNGEILFPNLPTGKTYWVRETATIEGYSIDTTLVKSATIVFGQTVEVVFTNSPVGYVQIMKIDSTDGETKLAGAVFGIYTSIECTTLVQTMPATGPDGIATSTALPYGPGYPAAYYLKELTAPEGYLLDPEVFAVALTEPGVTVPVIFANVPELGSIVIKKVDALNPNKTLAGAEFTLYYDMGMLEPAGKTPKVPNAATLLEVGKGTTGSDGILRFDDLIPGLYWLKETKAPRDYEVLEDYLPAVVISGQTDPEVIVILNQYNPPDPIPTGMAEWSILVVGCIALLGGGTILWLTRRRKALQSK